MSLSGNLEDVSVADALQFIHLGGRTGTLSLFAQGRTAEIGFHRGRIVNAWGPESKRLGDLLVDSGAIDSATLERALATQESETPRRSLGQILVSMNAIGAETMYRAVEQQIERTVYDLVTWTHGTFQFALDDLKPIDDIAVFPGDIVRHLNLDTQMVLLDALRIFDERNRDEAAGGPSSPARTAAAPVPPPAASAPAESPSAENALAASAPAETPPAERAPAASAPAESTPAERAPAVGTPAADAAPSAPAPEAGTTTERMSMPPLHVDLAEDVGAELADLLELRAQTGNGVGTVGQSVVASAERAGTLPTHAVGARPVTPADARRSVLARTTTAAAAAAASVTEPNARARLQVVTSDRHLPEKLAQLLVEEANVSRQTLREAGTPPPGEPPPMVLLDLRKGGVTLEAIEALRRTRPRAALLAIVDAEVPLARAFDAGVLSCVPPDLGVILAAFRSVVRSRIEMTAGSARVERVNANFAKLRRIVGDLRSGLISTTISLSLMNIISESVERAVLFLVRREALVALGAFGTNPEGSPLAQLTRGLRLPLDGRHALTAGLNDGQVRSVSFEEATFPETFAGIIGKPRSGQCAIFPVLGGQRVVAMVYADNGPSTRHIEEIEILELAAAQAGLAFENELLRRQAHI